MFKFVLLPCLLLLALIVGDAQADCMGPHHMPMCKIILEYDTTGGVRIDSVALLIPGYHPPDEPVSTWTVCAEGENSWMSLFRYGPTTDNQYPAVHDGHDTLGVSSHVGLDSFKVRLHANGREIESPMLRWIDDSSVFRLSIQGDRVILTNPVSITTPSSWTNYPWSLIGTILIELFAGVIYFARRNVPMRKVHSIITANLISHPLLWMLCTYVIGFGWGLFFGELAVVAFEAWWIWMFCKQFLTSKQCFNLSLLMNVLSVVVGGITEWFLQ